MNIFDSCKNLLCSCFMHSSREEREECFYALHDLSLSIVTDILLCYTLLSPRT